MPNSDEYEVLGSAILRLLDAVERTLVPKFRVLVCITLSRH